MTRPATASRPQTRTVCNGSVELAVYELGDPDGQTVVLVHGWPDTHHLWDGVAPHLAERFRVVSYDTRGHGRSTVPDRVADFRLSEFADDFFAVLDAVSPDAPVHVLAHDWGSVQVWEAVCEPGADERVASFTSISGPNLDHLAKWARSRLSHPTPRNVWQPASQLLSSLYTVFFMTPVLPRLFFGLVGTRAVWATFLRVVEGTDARNVHVADTLRRDMISGLRIYRANILERMLHPRERRTDVPVQLLVNTRDIAVRPAGYDDEGRWVSSLVRRDLRAGHWLPFSNPQVIGAATTSFIDGLDTDGIDGTDKESGS